MKISRYRGKEWVEKIQICCHEMAIDVCDGYFFDQDHDCIGGEGSVRRNWLFCPWCGEEIIDPIDPVDPIDPDDD